jgi:hypothetical protein
MEIMKNEYHPENAARMIVRCFPAAEGDRACSAIERELVAKYIVIR